MGGLCPYHRAGREPAFVHADRKTLVQVLTKLLTNAAKYTPAGGRLCLTMAAQAEQVVLAVEDNGIGMAPEFMPHVFELFAQAERTSDRSAGGLGMGLALVKSLVEMHDGKVACASPGLGQGRRFTVWLPRHHGTGNEVERVGTLLGQARAALAWCCSRNLGHSFFQYR